MGDIFVKNQVSVMKNSIRCVIVNYGTFELTKNTVNSILDYSYPFDVEIIIVNEVTYKECCTTSLQCICKEL